eukprot:GDKJ01013710.1.p1 GENE.GDKJ01013710.1~~GDKJ01013710.1.p1  ORF type:complete len:310 (+),score=52.95 GDKJ01013710.1:36-932(+)
MKCTGETVPSSTSTTSSQKSLPPVFNSLLYSIRLSLVSLACEFCTASATLAHSLLSLEYSHIFITPLCGWIDVYPFHVCQMLPVDSLSSLMRNHLKLVTEISHLLDILIREIGTEKYLIVLDRKVPLFSFFQSGLSSSQDKEFDAVMYPVVLRMAARIPVFPFSGSQPKIPTVLDRLFFFSWSIASHIKEHGFEILDQFSEDEECHGDETIQEIASSALLTTSLFFSHFLMDEKRGVIDSYIVQWTSGWRESDHVIGGMARDLGSMLLEGVVGGPGIPIGRRIRTLSFPDIVAECQRS